MSNPRQPAHPINPMLSKLGSFGGLTATMPFLPGSPAIDAGVAGGSDPATDERGTGYLRNVGPALGHLSFAEVIGAYLASRA